MKKARPLLTQETSQATKPFDHRLFVAHSIPQKGGFDTIKIKISYSTPEERERILLLLAPVLRFAKVKEIPGNPYSRIYLQF